ncbi:MAG: VOC family protein [bacterium]
MAIKRIGLSWVGVSDFNKSKDFFVNTLGLKIFEEQANYGWLEVQGTQGGPILGVGTANPEAGMPGGINAIVTFVTDTYDQTKQELAEKGVLFGEEIAGNPNIPRMIIFTDIEGNIFQLVEETPNQTDIKT